VPLTTLTVVGDIMLGRGVAGQPGGAAARLRPLARHLGASDLTVGNLESTLSDDGPPQQGTDSFFAPPAVLDALAGAGLDALSLANNHTGDYGEPALLETVAAFQGRRIESFGAGRDLRTATRPAVLTRHGLRFGFLGFNAIGETPRASTRTPGALSVRMPPRTGPLDQADLAHVVGAVRRLEQRVDVVVVLPHWGTQYTHVAEPVQSLVGRRLVDAGADLVVGGHPHWVQGIERYDGAVIAHSLGNFVFDMDFMEQTMEGVTLTARFRGERLRGVELMPYRLDATFSPRRVTGPGAAAILRDVRAHSVGPDR
jgi:poly-gamma-glutamate capsule biosynthesis protein CapA/YwtB (metallophosphatase superfamily)